MNSSVRRAIVNAMTLGVLVAGIAALLAGLAENISLAAELILLAAIIDGLDGALARALRATSDFGERLDTYVDTVTFGVVPAVVTYQALWADYGLWGSAAAGLVILMAVLRFARGCSFASPTGRHVFRGLPIPVSASWLAILLLVMDKDLFEVSPLAADRGAVIAVYSLVALVLVLLQISNVRYLKPSRRQLRTAMLAVLVAGLITRLPLTAFCAVASLSLLVYVIDGLRRHRAHALLARGDEHEAVIRR
ncbi:MAG: CDP-alcohol phosphatidyltransferase family protein [Kiritimatiellae bacterium]|nr:CDP-alcohol phosphatidyltransferase family protein [Kiritimatiellia bacterium]